MNTVKIYNLLYSLKLYCLLYHHSLEIFSNDGNVSNAMRACWVNNMATYECVELWLFCNLFVSWHNSCYIYILYCLRGWCAIVIYSVLMAYWSLKSSRRGIWLDNWESPPKNRNPRDPIIYYIRLPKYRNPRHFCKIHRLKVELQCQIRFAKKSKSTIRSGVCSFLVHFVLSSFSNFFVFCNL